ncbi:hypothetical protein CGC49_07525 [Capnocytophaga sp. H4358]|uniref:CAP domain-containing protein n=1 Tax=Capnocytophaga sp. H4358 TaxID=1945658 RepID=UPI000BB1CC2F|nr:CAP domain-containing protein [Capnocytophaga sp. H4358]ATA73138.1 hypothetical protein CGC49_07525 [Capnocytophaga sp. H4358]
MYKFFLTLILASGLMGGHQASNVFCQNRAVITQSKHLYDSEVRSLSLAQLQTIMIDYINSIRKKHKLPPYTIFDHPLAQEHSKYLFESGKDKELDWNDHFDAEGKSIFWRMKATKIRFKDVGENIVTVPPGATVRQLVDAWMESTMGHREALLSTEYKQVIIGHHPGSNNVVLDLVTLDDEK